MIEFCINNLTGDVLEIKTQLEKDHRFDVIEYGCLGYCGICAELPYALVNGEPIRGETANDLLKKIYQAVDEMEFYF